MKTPFHSGLSVGVLHVVRCTVAHLLVLLLLACGGGGESSPTPPARAVIVSNPRALPPEYLARTAVSYSPFRTGNRDTENVSSAMVKQDLDLLVQGNFRLIRLFDSSDKVAKLVLDVIVDNNMDIKVQLGAYVNSFREDKVPNPYQREAVKTENINELDRAVALATNPKYKDVILTVSVGNETLVNWSVVPIDVQTLASYIKRVRDRVTQPVTTDDNFLAFTNPAPRPVVEQIDFLAIHTYPGIDAEYPESDYYWDWKQLGVAAGPARAQAMMDAGIAELRRQYGLVRLAVDGIGLKSMPIAITETGWNAVDKGKQKYRAHPVNQKMFYQRLETFRAEGRLGQGPANIVYFEAFDEPWKQGDDGWGLFNVDRKARYVVQALYPQSQWESTTLTDANAVYFAPPTPNAAVTTTQLAVYSDASGIPAATGLRVDPFDGNSVSAPEVGTAVPPEGSKSIEITPVPKNYGWGLIWGQATTGNSINMSQFAATGSLTLWVKTTYPGKIELGLSTLNNDGESQESYLQIGNGDYGYCNTDSWCQVSVPLQAFKTKNPKIDFSLVLSPFIISDRYSYTGKALNSNITTKVNIDGVVWSR